MSNYQVINLTATDLKKICNPITAIAICIQLWRHFLSIFRKRAQDAQQNRVDNTIKFCMEHITYNLLMLGALTEELTTSVISMTIYKVAIISNINHPTNAKTTISFCDLSVKDVGNLRPDIIVEFLMKLVKECSIMIKENPKGPFFSQYVNYYSESIYDVADILKKSFYQVTRIQGIVDPEEYISGFLSLELKREAEPATHIQVSENMNLEVTNPSDTV